MKEYTNELEELIDCCFTRWVGDNRLEHDEELMDAFFKIYWAGFTKALSIMIEANETK